MAETDIVAPNGHTVPGEAAEPKRLQSTIEFPYHDLDDVEKIAKAVHAVGGLSCAVEQLAAQLTLPVSGGALRMRMIAARMFGLLTYDSTTVTLTDLGARLNDPQQERAARAEAFLKVPLYSKLYEQYRGKTLPANPGLETAIANLGVSVKQKDRARQAFQRSAKSAGFFDFGQDRLVLPVTKQPSAIAPQTSVISATPAEVPTKPEEKPTSVEYHPFIQGLLQKLPPPEKDWTLEGRKKWLQTAANIFDLMYRDVTNQGCIVIELKKAATLNDDDPKGQK